MRWNEILVERAPIQIDDLDEMWPTIAQSCSEALAAMKTAGQCLYRGIKNASEPAFVDVPRTDRIPRDVPEEIHHMIDDWMREHGFQARRTNSVFVTSNEYDAMYYGPASNDYYIIIPKNGFSFTWFLKCRDLYTYLKKDVYNDKAQILWKPDQFASILEEIMARVKPQKDGLNYAITSGNEIMISGSEFYAFSHQQMGGEVMKRILR